MVSPDVLEPLSAKEDAPPQKAIPDPRIAVLQSPTAPATEQEAAFAEIVGEFEGPLLGYAAKMVGTNHAEDIVQVTFLNAFRRLGNFDNRSTEALSGWLHMITKNTAINHAKKSKRDPLADRVANLESGNEGSIENHPSRMGEPEPRLEFQETLGVLKGVNARQLDVMLKRAVGLSHDEIAGLHDTTVSAVKSLLVRGRDRAARLLVEAESFDAAHEPAKAETARRS